MDLPYIFAALLAALIWGICTLLSLHGQMRAAQSEKTGRVVMLFFIWCSIISMLGTAAIPAGALQFARPDSAMQFVIANTLSVLLVSTVIYAVYAKYMSLSAGGTRMIKGRRGRATSTVGMSGATLLIFSFGNYFATSYWMPSPRGGAMAVCGATFVASIVVIHFQRRLLGVGKKGVPFPLEESPLTDELCAIAAAMGADGTKLRVVPTKSGDGESTDLTPTQMSSVLQTWVFHPRRKPTIPIELFQRLDPRELTALIALRYALGMPPKHTGFWWRIPLALLGLIGIVLLLVPATVIAFDHYNPHIILKIIVSVAMFYSGIFLFFKVLRLAGLWREPHLYWVDGFAAWKDAAPEGETRDFIDFTYALLGFDSLLHAIPRDEKLVVLLAKNVHIIKAAKIVTGMEREDYLLAVTTRVAEMGATTAPA